MCAVQRRAAYLGAAAFGGHQRLFLYVKPSRDSRLAMDEESVRPFVYD